MYPVSVVNKMAGGMTSLWSLNFAPFNFVKMGGSAVIEKIILIISADEQNFGTYLKGTIEL